MRSSSVISRLEVVGDPRAPLAGVLLLQLGQLVLDDLADPGRVGEDVLELGDELDDREVLVLDLLALEGGQAGEPHVEDGLRLELGQVEPAHQVVAGVLDLVRLADGLDDRVEVVEGDLEAFEDVRPGARLGEVELGPAPDDLAPVVEVVDEHASSGSVCGWPSTSASMFMLNASCIGVCLNRLLSTLCGLASRLSSM